MSSILVATLRHALGLLSAGQPARCYKELRQGQTNGSHLRGHTERLLWGILTVTLQVVTGQPVIAIYVVVPRREISFYEELFVAG